MTAIINKVDSVFTKQEYYCKCAMLDNIECKFCKILEEHPLKLPYMPECIYCKIYLPRCFDMGKYKQWLNRECTFEDRTFSELYNFCISSISPLDKKNYCKRATACEYGQKCFICPEDFVTMFDAETFRESWKEQIESVREKND